MWHAPDAVGGTLPHYLIPKVERQCGQKRVRHARLSTLRHSSTKEKHKLERVMKHRQPLTDVDGQEVQ